MLSRIQGRPAYGQNRTFPRTLVRDPIFFPVKTANFPKPPKLPKKCFYQVILILNNLSFYNTRMCYFQGKLSVILVVWIALIVLTTFYCYFCEQRLFPKNALRMGEFSNLNEEASITTDDQQSGHLHANMAAALPKSDHRQSRKEVLQYTQCAL